MKIFIKWLKCLMWPPKRTSRAMNQQNDEKTTRPMKNICQTLQDLRSKPTRALVIMPTRPKAYWLGLPIYADMYIRKPYEMITDIEGLLEFCQHFLVEYSECDNPHKRTAIEAVVFPIYRSLAGWEYDTDQFKQI